MTVRRIMHGWASLVGGALVLGAVGYAAAADVTVSLPEGFNLGGGMGLGMLVLGLAGGAYFTVKGIVYLKANWNGSSDVDGRFDALEGMIRKLEETVQKYQEEDRETHAKLFDLSRGQGERIARLEG